MLRRVETNPLKTKEVQPFAAQMDETPLHPKGEYDYENHLYSIGDYLISDIFLCENQFTPSI